MEHCDSFTEGVGVDFQSECFGVSGQSREDLVGAALSSMRGQVSGIADGVPDGR